jgi:hypothetical protein
MRSLLVSIALVLLLGGCQLSPVISGVAIDQGLFVDGLHPKTWTLKEQQLEQLAVWLKEHDSAWSHLLVTPPPPTFLILLNHADGSPSSIQLFSANENWEHALVIKDRIRTISRKERNELLQLAKGLPNG